MTLSQVTKNFYWREELSESWFSLNGQVKLHPSENFYLIIDVHGIFLFLYFCAERSVSYAVSVSNGKADH